MMCQEIYQESLKKAKHKIWILSDLQQANPDYARECVHVGVEDFLSLGSPAEMIWYLGDSIEGQNAVHLDNMVQMQEEIFGSLSLPLCYTIGNHDFDYTRSLPEGAAPYLPFYEMVKQHPGWHAIQTLQDFCFSVPLGNDYTIYFFSDHIAPDHRWYSTHGHIEGSDISAYPYDEAFFTNLRSRINTCSTPVFTASHYGFPGANRASDLLGKLFPLGKNVRCHFYGHSHIRDFVWGRENGCRRISWADWHDIPQIDVSSFEHIRGKKVRSVFLHIYEDHTFGIFFRNHDDHLFSECYFPAGEQLCDATQLTCKDVHNQHFDLPEPHWLL